MLLLIPVVFIGCTSKSPNFRPLEVYGPIFKASYYRGSASKAESMTIKNPNSHDATHVIFTARDGLHINHASSCKIIKSGQSCQVFVVFTGTKIGPYNNKITLSYRLNNKPEADIQIPIKTQVVEQAVQGQLAISGSKLGHHVLSVGDKKNFKITLTNQYVDQSVYIDKIVLPAYFVQALSSTCAGARLAKNQSCDLDLIFTTPFGDLQFNTNAIKIKMILTRLLTGLAQERDFELKLEGDVLIAKSKSGEAGLKAILAQRAALGVDEDYIKLHNRDYVYKNYKYSVDNNGEFYRTPVSGGNKEILSIENDSKIGKFLVYRILDKKTGRELFALSANPGLTSKEDFAAFEDFAKIIREYGIFSLKYENPDCYIAYARERLFPQNNDAALFERLEALERFQDPRPLPFLLDKDWKDFQQDIKTLFEDFKDPNPVKDPLKDPGPKIAVIGTGTTFVSQNPAKGKLANLFESSPICKNSAQDPIEALKVYTFDTPNTKEASDVDVHIFIPALSRLCEKADAKNLISVSGGGRGNDGIRRTYRQNSLVECLEELWDFDPIRANFERKYKNFKNKWGRDLGPFKLKADPASPIPDKGRRVNFSVHILPDQAKAPLKKPINNFDDEPLLKGRFVVPLNDKK
jgi:hypothetical protein